MKLIKVLISVLLFCAAVIYPCESRDATADFQDDAHSHSPTNHERQSRAPGLAHPQRYSSSYRMRRVDAPSDTNSSHLTVVHDVRSILERSRVLGAQLGDWLENTGFLPVTINIPDVLAGLYSWFPNNAAGSTPRKLIKMLSKMYKEITTNSDLKDELKVISEHASEFESGFKTFWDAIDFSEEFEAIVKYISK
ncbi:unnamed protein product [Bemisia tabaci]|uniref:Uncharacterized protein n=1 Tax=Bemisia tabaci TaxID=7038 RepID=A0A9P0G097_BEMTA|nr:unnamed protein product [Bemisia tabaci]